MSSPVSKTNFFLQKSHYVAPFYTIDQKCIIQECVFVYFISCTKSKLGISENLSAWLLHLLLLSRTLVPTNLNGLHSDWLWHGHIVKWWRVNLLSIPLHCPSNPSLLIVGTWWGQQDLHVQLLHSSGGWSIPFPVWKLHNWTCTS